MIGAVALTLVIAGLVSTACAQVRPLVRHRMRLDTLALVPEWRFYAQASLTAEDFARDTHIMVRDRGADDRVGSWTPVLWPVERHLGHAIWNPWMRVEQLILSLAEDLAGGMAGVQVQQSIGYLVVLRCAFAAPRGAGVARQFAIVHTTGREQRTLSIDFVSAWHCW